MCGSPTACLYWIGLEEEKWTAGALLKYGLKFYVRMGDLYLFNFFWLSREDSVEHVAAEERWQFHHVSEKVVNGAHVLFEELKTL